MGQGFGINPDIGGMRIYEAMRLRLPDFFIHSGDTIYADGPLNAGSFGPNPLDKTFGPELVFQKVPPTQNTSPFAGFQFFGEVNIDGQSAALTVTLRDLDGVAVFEKTLAPAVS